MDLVAKKEEIGLVLAAPDVDLWKLRELCLTEGGLVDDSLRKRAWPKLVGLHGSAHLEEEEEEEKKPSSLERSGRSRVRAADELPPSGIASFQFEGIKKVDSDDKQKHHDEQEEEVLVPNKNRIAECVDAAQIDRDVARCTWHLLTGSQRSRRLQMENKHRKKVASILKRKQVRLSNFINLTLVQANATLPEQDHLRYYQGFHDVASVFLSSLGGGGSGPISKSSSNASPLERVASSMGLDLPSKVLGQVAKSHFRDAMRSNFMQLQSALRLTLFPLLARFDPEVHAHLYYCDMEPFFALSWIITWFSHDVRDTAVVKRLFDAFIVSHPLFPLYLSAAMILHPINRAEILSTDCDFASVHQTLANLPKNSSMVGWHFRVKDGYLSGDEVSTASTDMDSTFLSEEILDLVDGDGASVSTSSLSGTGGVRRSRARVPFQELIDTALSYMRRVPPRKLMGLAKRYFAEDPARDLLFDQANSISLLQSPPSWGLAATTPADWVLKQRLRTSRGLKSTNRRDRRQRSNSRTRSETTASADLNDIEEVARYLEEKQRTLAVIASGYGPGDDDEERRRKRRKMLMWGAVAVAIVAVSYAVMTQYSPAVTPCPDSTGETSSGSIERDLLQSNERPNKTSLPAMQPSKEHSATNRQMMESARPSSSYERPTQSQRHETHGGGGSSRPKTVEFEVNPRGSVHSVPLNMEQAQTNGAMQRTSAPGASRGESSTSKTSASMQGRTERSSSSSGGRSAQTNRDTVVPGPLRYMKGLLISTRQALNSVDRLPGSQWVTGVYRDVRRAVDEIDPNLVVPGLHLVPDFLRKARRSITGGDGSQYVKETIEDTTGRETNLVRGVLKNIHRFFAKRGQGRRALKSARRALTENEADFVVL